MLSRLGSRLSYANVVSTACLFIVLGGTSYAVATGSIDSREIKNNTVRSKDIRNNQVRSGDVRNQSLLATDFKAGQLPAGPRGPKGDNGDKGAKGDRGPSNGYFGGASQTLSAPGNYLLWGRGYINNTTGSEVQANCSFSATGVGNGGTGSANGVADVPAGKEASLPVIGSLTSTGTPTVTLSCTAGGASTNAAFVAIKVETL